MIHETKRVQAVAAVWHALLAIGALGALTYHIIATVEHWRSTGVKNS